jgi:methyl-accepting chemotaxis protein
MPLQKAPPAMKHFVLNLSLGRKFALIGALALAMTAAPTAVVVSTHRATLAADEAESLGVAPAGHLMDVVRLTQQHRGLSAVALSGDEKSWALRQAKAGEVAQALARLQGSLATLGLPALTQQLQALDTRWQGLAASVGQRQLPPAESFAQHTALITAQLALLEGVIDGSAMALDPQAETYYLIQAALDQLPALTETLGQLRARGASALTKGEASPEQRAQITALVSLARSQAQKAYGAYGKSLTASPALQSRLAATSTAARQAADAALKLAETQIVQAATLSMAGPAYFAAQTQAIDAQFGLVDASMQALHAALTERVAHDRQVLIALIATIAVLGSAAAVLMLTISRTTSGALKSAVQMAEAVAAGNLGARIDLQRRDEIGQLGNALQRMNGSLLSIVRQVRTSSDSIATGSAQIASGSLDLSQRTEEQAANLEQTAASMEELTATVRQNSATAAQATTLAQQARSAAEEGGSVVGRVVSTMHGISEASRRIADITGVIDSIAFQTNILALNAAVEAARAGEQGRGFAVVASEVRALAQRSAEAAREIKALVGASVEQAATGTQLVDEAGRSVQAIVGRVQRVSELIHEISAASQEQAQGIGQVGDAVNQLDQVTQQNAALVEESTAAADSLRQQAARLATLVGSFRLPEAMPAAPAA